MPEDIDEMIRRLEALEILVSGLSRRERRVIPKTVLSLLRIYAFKNIFSPFEVNWIFRAKEEEVAFSMFKKTSVGDLLPHFENLRYSGAHPQIFYVDLIYPKSRKTAIIRVPKLYPSLPPNSIISTDRSLEVYTSHTNQEKCLGELVKGRWDEKGKMGIPHWLLFVEVYLNLKEKPIKV